MHKLTAASKLQRLIAISDSDKFTGKRTKLADGLAVYHFGGSGYSKLAIVTRSTIRNSSPQIGKQIEMYIRRENYAVTNCGYRNYCFTYNDHEI